MWITMFGEVPLGTRLLQLTFGPKIRPINQVRFAVTEIATLPNRIAPEAKNRDGTGESSSQNFFPTTVCFSLTSVFNVGCNRLC